MVTWWRGVKLDDRSAAMMTEVAKLTTPYIQPSQGSYNGGGVRASAGTHDGGGSIDISAASLTPAQRSEVVEKMRMCGWAAWLRTPRQANWGYHIHAIAVGCPDLSSGAAHQVREYFAGRNGLASRGADDATRAYVGATWESYVAGKPKADPYPGVYGAIRQKWNELGAEKSVLGLPLNEESDGKVPGSRYNRFERGVILWSPETNAHEVYGAILTRWWELGGEDGSLGLPVSGELNTSTAGGRYQLFQHGEIVWSPWTGAHEIYGDILGTYRIVGAEGYVGFPVGHEEDLDGGRIQSFQRANIVWSPEHGAHVVGGEIGATWSLDTHGWPLTGENNSLIQHFENGMIVWDEPFQSVRDVVYRPQEK